MSFFKFTVIYAVFHHHCIHPKAILPDFYYASISRAVFKPPTPCRVKTRHTFNDKQPYLIQLNDYILFHPKYELLLQTCHIRKVAAVFVVVKPISVYEDIRYFESHIIGLQRHFPL